MLTVSPRFKVFAWYGFFKLMQGVGFMIWLLGAMFEVAGGLVLVDRTVRWLKTGVWLTDTTNYALSEFTQSWTWLQHPTSWLGVWQIVNGILSLPAWVVFPLVGLPFAGFGYLWRIGFKEAAEDAKRGEIPENIFE
jgi:hypothetical protein